MGLAEAIVTIIFVVIAFFIAYKVYAALGASTLFIVILVFAIILAIAFFIFKR